MLGRMGFEASFRLDRQPEGYRIIFTPRSNQFRKQTVAIFPGTTFAIFHVHTVESIPAPSDADRQIADQHNVRVYTIHNRGLYAYDPITQRTTQLRVGTGWLDRPNARTSARR